MEFVLPYAAMLQHRTSANTQLLNSIAQCIHDFHRLCVQDGLSGNSRTVMIATVAASADQYHHSINTLKYANRAKDIKTHIVQNVGSVESHISDYRRIIDNLQVCAWLL